MASDSSVCQKIHERIKPFLDDLLAEEEYQETRTHLDTCRSCRKKVEAVGSFWHHIQELANVEVPADFGSTVVFRLQAAPAAVRRTEELKPQSTWFFKLAVFLILGVGGAWLANTYFRNHPAPIQTPPPQMTTQVFHEPEPVSEEEAKILYQELNAIAKVLGPPKSKSDTDVAVNQPVLPPERAAEEPVPAGKTEAAVPKREHWHFRYEREMTKTKVLDTIHVLRIRIRFQGAAALVLEATGEQLKRLEEEARRISNQASPLMRFTIERGGKEQKHIVSIFFQSLSQSRPDVYHWHLRFSLSNRDRLPDLFHQAGALLTYQSEDIIVAELARKKIEALNLEMKRIEGIFVESDALKPLTEAPAGEESVALSLFIES